jgi:hypothetical protein
VSAAVTLTVLVVWERLHPLPVIPGGSLPRQTQALATPTGQAGVAEAGTPRPTFPPGQVLLTIENVFSPGTLANELVLIKSSSEISLPMAGWKLDDGAGKVYIFPSLDLNPGGAVQLHSGTGDNTPIDLFWGLDAPVWQVGKTVTLSDEQGNVRSTFTIP